LSGFDFFFCVLGGTARLIDDPEVTPEEEVGAPSFGSELCDVEERGVS
jgi:hypothetical protein